MTLLNFFMPTYFNYHIFYTDVSSDPFKTSARKNHLPSILIHNLLLFVFFWPCFLGNMAYRSFSLERLLFCCFIKKDRDYTTFSFFRFYGLGVF